MADIKPIYKKIDGKWVKQNAYEKQNNQWIKISTTDTEENMVSYLGWSMTEDICDELFTEPTMQVVERDNLLGNISLTTISNGYIYWITPTPISSISIPPFPVPYTELNSAYVYNGVSYHCYTSNGVLIPDTYNFVIT